MSFYFLIDYKIFILAKKRPVDLGIIFGANGQNAPSNFVAEKKFIEDMIKRYISSHPNMKFGAIVYSNDARVLFRFDDQSKSQSAITAIRQLQRRRRGNNILAALNLALKDLFGSRATARLNASRALVILMDKASFRDEKLLEAAKMLKENGVKIIVVAIGPEAVTKAISDIPSETAGMIRIRDFSKDTSKAIRLIESQIPQSEWYFHGYIQTCLFLIELPRPH